MPHLRAIAFALALSLPLCAHSPAAGAAGGFGGGGGGRSPMMQDLRAIAEQTKELLRTGDYPAAEKIARQRLEFVKSRFGEDHRAYGGPLGLLGRVLFLQGRYEEAEAVSRRALDLRERSFGSRDERVRGALLHLGEVLAARNNYSEAEALLRRVVDDPDPERRVTVLLALGALMKDLGRYAEAEALARQAADVSAAAERGSGRGKMALALHLSAQIKADQGLTVEALELARRALSLVERRVGEEHPSALRISVFVAELLHELRRDEEAAARLQKVIATSEKSLGRLHPLTGGAHLQLALAYDALGRPEQAEASYRSAVRAARSTAIPMQLAQAARAYGRHLAQRERLAEALPYYREAIEMVERVFAETRGQSEEIRQRFAGRLNAYHHEMIELLVRLHARDPSAGHDREALAVASLTQSRIFSELLRQADVNQFVRDDAFKRLERQRLAAVDRLRGLRRELAASGLSERESEADDDDDDGEEQPAAGASSARVQDARAENLRRQVADARRELAEAGDLLRRRYPRYVELTQPQPVTAAQVQQLLKPGEAVLTFAVLPRELAVFAVTREQFRMAVSPVDGAALADKIRAVRSVGETFAATGSLAALGRLDPAQLHELYRVLVAPVDAVLAPAARVLVAGDGPVHTLPLEMLVTRYGEAERRAFAAARSAGPALAEYATLPYLGLRTHFSYLPSLSALPSQRLYAKPAVRYQRELVSFADPVFGSEPEAKSAIPRLPETADEAREIAKALGGKAQLYLRDEAQESTLKSLDLKATRYLHFATHGFLAGEFLPSPGEQRAAGADPLVPTPANRPAASRPARVTQPALALTLVGDLHGEDGLLTMKEVIESLDLNAELVVLSACNTAGEDRAGSGEGFAGLTRSFMYAGARALLVSHWSVESVSTQEFVTDVFRQVKQGRTVGDAVFEARRTMLAGSADGRPRAHPYFWAPFVHVGD